jgi:integrase
MATLKIEFGKARSDGKRKIYVILSQHGKRKRLDPKIDVAPEDMKKTKAGIKLSASRQNALDKALARYRDMIYQVEKDHMGQYIDVDMLYDHLTGKKSADGGIDFFAFAEEYIASSKMKGAKNYRTMLNDLERHLGKRVLPFSDITYAMLDDYARSLDDRPRAKTLYLGAIRHLHNEARRRYNTDTEMVISTTIFDRFRVPRQQQKGQRALPVEVLRQVFAFQGRGRAALARDCFVLSFLLMGMNSADLYDDDAKVVDGKICYHRKKVRDRRQDKAYIEVTIPEEAKALMQKYAGKKRVFKFHEMYSDEGTFNKAINIGLRKIKEALGLEELQFYQARHTWASIARNECGIDAYTVDKALNHIPKDMALLDVYVKKDYRLINEANKKVIAYCISREECSEINN